MKKQQPLTSLNTQLGPWAGYVNTYTKLIKEQGYAPVSVQDQIRLITRFIGWLRRMHTEIGSLDETVVHRFLRHRQSVGCTRHGDAAALDRFLHMLRGEGVAPPEKQSPLFPRQRLIANYERYLLQERGLAQGTVVNYGALVDQFLSTRFRQRPLNLSQLGAPDVTGFVRQRAHKLRPQCAQLLVTALRSFLRYLQHQGKVGADLAVCVPSVARWSFAALPKFLPARSVRRVLQRNKGRTPIRSRDYAILLLLARLGLRAGAVVALNLEDIDWEHARITIREKGGHQVQLPLPADVGEAIAHYLRHGRPCCSSRRVCLRYRAPRTGFANWKAISSLVVRALERAGVSSARKGAHLFRHSLATDMIRRGASLDEIGDLLGHRSPETTMIYAKVDVPALRTLALSGPGGAR
jgi:site-specific recombinase XerD